MKRFTFIILIICFDCADTKEYQVQFDNVDWLEKGTPVYIKGLKVGQVKELKFDEDKRALATIQIDGYIKITNGSKFTMQSDLMGAKSIEIELADSEELTDQDQIQTGYLKPVDTAGMRRISKHEFDSLAKVDPKYKLADTLFKVLSTVRDNLDRKNKK